MRPFLSGSAFIRGHARPLLAVLATLSLCGVLESASGQETRQGTLAERLSAMTAVTGYEQRLVDTLLSLMPASQRDRAGNAVLTLGSGEPRRLVVCPIDEPGYVVGGIRDDGFLTLRRVGRASTALFDQQLEGQRVTVFGRNRPIPGVVAVRSVHLARGRPTGDEPFSVDNAYLDIGAGSAKEVADAGVAVLTPVSLEKRPHLYGTDLLAALSAGRRTACSALISAALSARPLAGTVIAGFVVEQSLSARGLLTLGNARGPFAETLVLDGRAGTPGTIGESVDSIPGAPHRFGRVSRWTLAVRYPETPVESISLRDAEALAGKLSDWISGSTEQSRGEEVPRSASAKTNLVLTPSIGQAKAPALGEAEQLLRNLVERYGVSGMESPVRDAVKAQLPSWAATETDTAGNLILRVGKGDPVVVFVAHLDEIGFQVTKIRDDGSLEIAQRGGFFSSLFEARPALVHTPDKDVPGVFAPRDSIGSPLKRTPGSFRVNVGTSSRAESEALGIAVGHTVTMPKSFQRLLGTRATGRSFDDRVGATAQILAVRHLDPARLKHSVIFIWSVREEIGLDGAQVAARGLGLSPARVHAIDTFVSADSPLELPNFGLAPLGQGAVARATDNSSVTPPAYVDSLVALARGQRIALQVGTTNGGNDGSVFAEFGVPDVAIGWPLRYAHSPAEVIDLKDVVSLSDLIRAIAERW